jgi:hypothetical protein
LTIEQTLFFGWQLDRKLESTQETTYLFDRLQLEC